MPVLNVMLVLEGGDFGRQLDHEGGVLMSGVSPPMGEPRPFLSGATQGEVCHQKEDP